MKRIELDQALTLLANMGVIVGILLLVYELAQNRAMMEAQTRNDLFTGLTTYLSLSSEPEFQVLMEKIHNGEELSPPEFGRVSNIRTIQLRYFENVHYQYRRGLFDEEEFAAQRRVWRNLFAEEFRAKHWCRVRYSYSPEFAEEIDNLLTTYQCE